MTEQAFAGALIAELAKKTGVSWLTYGGATHAVWHVWVDDALYVVSDGTEQPLPGIADVDRVEVTMRSKENGGRLVTWVAERSDVLPDHDLWPVVTPALVSGRLNAPDLATTADGWSRTSRVTRLAPSGELLEEPGSLSDDAHLAVPRPTAATTRGALPRILHRRVTRRPKLS